MANNERLSLRALYDQHSQKVSAKWSSYLDLYDTIFTPYRDAHVHMLELGVQNGGSLDIWAKYFENAELFVGCDIDPLCERLAYDDARIQLVLGDINTPEAYDQVITHADHYDIIIDDASHRSGDIIQSFVKLFPTLKEGGIYVVEDLHCSYWQAYDGGLYDPHSAIAFFKQCADVVNHEHWGLSLDKSAVFDQGISEKYHVTLSDQAFENIASVAFYNSVCVIKKGDPSLGPLVVSGQVELVSKGNIELNGKTSQALSQLTNVWSQKHDFDNQDVIALTQRLQEVSAALAHEKTVSAQKQTFMEKTCEQLANETADHNALKSKHAHLITENAQLLSSLETLNASLSWQITKPLRGLKGLFDRLSNNRSE